MRTAPSRVYKQMGSPEPYLNVADVETGMSVEGPGRVKRTKGDLQLFS
jgi:hypothetical protein